MYKLEFSTTAQKQFLKLDIEMQIRIKRVLNRIRFKPHIHLKKLKGLQNYSLRVGDYRLIIELIRDKLIVFVIEIDHRKKIYKKK